MALRGLRPRAAKEAFLTLNFEPGAAFQVDWADFGFALPGCLRRVSAFVMAACYSRYLYIEFTLSQAMGTFLRCMERALRFFGGVALADIFDNMKTVVLSHARHATVFNRVQIPNCMFTPPSSLRRAIASASGQRRAEANLAEQDGRRTDPTGR